ncbi:RluA family pseudouridine synthase [Geobacter argillaceus]|uniref:23S rRNA pseudouridine955/2504/2580 synthase n=1 Tax=Geobacter argillaceus TaxID=345631 RepID=A0A562V8W4_9BACT|nr:RluA family pseudouridine synthase [Geobacter argillaceus]TWJ14345.1 23S rRNA pseudouridine955/2504/2580 synthase [Geobacter argillaceus]
MLALTARNGYSPSMLSFSITESDHCRQLESWLHTVLPTAPAAYLRKLQTRGHLLVNDQPATATTLLVSGDHIAMKESARTRELLASTRPLLDILYEDERVIVANKPPELPVHRTGEDEPTLLAVAERFLELRGTPCRLRPVNRLDRGTSGAIILAKSSLAAGMFGRLVKEVGLGKLYLAIVPGQLPDAGIITSPLAGKEAVTHFRCLFQGATEAFLALVPLTGRTHQLRRHLQQLGHPIIGDRRYGGPTLPDNQGHLLHAFLLTLRHPENERELGITAPLPPGFLSTLKTLAGPSSGELLAALPHLSLADISR